MQPNNPPSATRPTVTSTPAGDDGVAMPNPHLHWYVAVVRSNCELRTADLIAAEFRNAGRYIEYWVPFKRTSRLNSRGKLVHHDTPLLRTFIFFHVEPRDINIIRFRSDVYKILTLPGQRDLYVIPDTEMRAFRQMFVDPDTEVTIQYTRFARNTKVRIIGGRFEGQEAYVQRDNGKRVVVGNELRFLCGATVEIDRTLVVPI